MSTIIQCDECQKHLSHSDIVKPRISVLLEPIPAFPGKSQISYDSNCAPSWTHLHFCDEHCLRQWFKTGD
jgi:hypothetical protein